MNIPFLALIAASWLPFALNIYTLTLVPPWAERGIHTLGSPRLTLALASAAGIAAAAIVNPHVGLPAAVAAGASVWLAVLATSTDLACMKIPREADKPVLIVSVVAFAFSHPQMPNLLSLGVAAVALGICTAFSVFTRTGLGLGDIRLLRAFTAASLWWFTANNILMFYIVACVIQLVLRLLTLRSNFGSRAATPSAPTAQGTPLAMPADVHPAGSGPEGPRKTGRRLLPFGPALALSYVGFLTYSAVSATTACSSWALPTGSC